MNIRVLLIDDIETFLTGLKKLFQVQKIQVDTAGTFEKAMTLLTKRDYNAVISDISLSGTLGKEGLDILRYIKSYKPNTKVVLMTGNGNPEIMKEAFNFGADFYFEKPISADSLLDAIKNDI